MGHLTRKITTINKYEGKASKTDPCGRNKEVSGGAEHRNLAKPGPGTRAIHSDQGGKKEVF